MVELSIVLYPIDVLESGIDQDFSAHVTWGQSEQDDVIFGIVLFELGHHVDLSVDEA